MKKRTIKKAPKVRSVSRKQAKKAAQSLKKVFEADQPGPEGSIIITLPLTKKEAQTMYDAALVQNNITLQELEYQRKGLKATSLKKLVVGAFILQCITEFVEQESKK